MQYFLKLRKNKTFHYTPRYYQGGEHSFRIEHKLDKFRSTAQTTKGLANKFSSALNDLKMTGDKHTKLRFFSIVAILVVVFLSVIDFDLSIFL